jgi:hypothetical protein
VTGVTSRYLTYLPDGRDNWAIGLPSALSSKPHIHSMAYTLCDSEASLQTAVDYLSGHHLVLDCEGKDLGRRGGALGLISLARSDNDDSIFLLDPLSLDATSPAMIKLLSILSNPNTYKIVWDGRMDAIALLEKYGVVLAGVLDLQLAEIMSRNLRGENDENRKSRLYSAVGSSVRNSPHLYEYVYPLCGLDRCLKDMGVGSEYAKSGKCDTCFGINQALIFAQRFCQEDASRVWECAVDDPPYSPRASRIRSQRRSRYSSTSPSLRQEQLDHR